MPTLNFDQALEKFIDRFLALHPKPTWPPWFRACTTYGGSREADRSWRLAFTASLKPELAPGEAWEVSAGGSMVLTRTDPATGEKHYIISSAGGETLTVFEARVDGVSGVVTVLHDQPLDTINGEALLPMRK